LFNPKAIIDELKTSDLPAEVVLDRQRKKQIEHEMAEKEEAERRKRDKQREFSIDVLRINLNFYRRETTRKRPGILWHGQAHWETLFPCEIFASLKWTRSTNR
jgi:glycerol-3-phosphate O-acyltransferase